MRLLCFAGSELPLKQSELPELDIGAFKLTSDISPDSAGSVSTTDKVSLDKEKTEQPARSEPVISRTESVSQARASSETHVPPAKTKHKTKQAVSTHLSVYQCLYTGWKGYKCHYCN